MRSPFAAGLFLIALLALSLNLPPAASADKAPEASEVSIKADKDAIEFYAGKALVTRYSIGPKVAKPYFWPLNAPNGAPVTRAWPMGKLDAGEKSDHKHQKSAWFCHGDVIPEGLKIGETTRYATGVDFWSEEKGHGRIVCTKVGEIKQGKGHGSAVTYNEWRTADGVKILDEKRTIELFVFGDGWLVRVSSELTASVVNIVFGDTKEGSFGVRVRDVMRADKKGTLTNAEGKKGEGKKSNAARDGCWGLASKWCDYSGPTDAGTAGIALFAGPANSLPTFWHSRNYGLMAANPFGRAKAGFPDTKGRKDLFKLAKGRTLRLVYGMYLHKGDAEAGKVAEAYARFAKLGGVGERAHRRGFDPRAR